jgi:hypothetical protein
LVSKQPWCSSNATVKNTNRRGHTPEHHEA